jgi:hypothetical protein
MKYVIGIFLFGLIIISSACSEDPSESDECNRATKELEDATEAVRILKSHAPPTVCNPCTVQQAYQIQLSKLVKIEAEKKAAKTKACS